MSASCSPCWPRDTAPIGYTRARLASAAFFEDVSGDAGVVVHRRRVRHARHRGEAAGDRRRGAGRDRLLVLLARLAQVHVHVDQPGTHDEAAAESRRPWRRASTGRSRPTRAMRPPSISTSNSPSRPLAGSTTRPPFSSRSHLSPLRLRPPAGRAPPSARRRRWRPARESPNTGRRRRRTRSRRRGSSAPDA